MMPPPLYRSEAFYEDLAPHPERRNLPRRRLRQWLGLAAPLITALAASGSWWMLLPSA